MIKKDGTKLFYDHLIEDRRKEITAEQDAIRQKYSLDNYTIELIHKFYKSNSNITLGNVSKTIDFIAYILKAYGYSKEDISSFIIINRRMVLSNYSDFVLRLAIFNKCGLLEEVFFKNYLLLCYEGLMTGLTTRELYAFAKKNDFKITLKDYTKSSNLMPKDKKKIVKNYPLCKESINQLNTELLSTIKEIKEQNVTTKKLKK